MKCGTINVLIIYAPYRRSLRPRGLPWYPFRLRLPIGWVGGAVGLGAGYGDPLPRMRDARVVPLSGDGLSPFRPLAARQG